MSSAPTPPPSRRTLLLGALTTAALGSTWGCSRGARYGASDSPTGAPAAGTATKVELRVDGEVVRPVLELATEVDVVWIDAETGTTLGEGPTPTLQTEAVRRVGLRVHAGNTPALDSVVTLNLGFDPDDDYGRLSLPPSYEHEPQPVTGVSGLAALSGLVRFCAARTPMSGHLDLSGLSRLESVEVYGSEIESIDLTGCANLLRLCVEDCRLTDLDLGPVRHSLEDLRAAIQRSNHLRLAPLAGPMDALYHYCIREQVVPDSIPHHHLPVVEEYWVWASGQQSCDAPISPHLRSYLARDNSLDQASVDAVLTGLVAAAPKASGRLDLTGGASEGGENAPPSTAGRQAIEDLLAKGWRVDTN